MAMKRMWKPAAARGLRCAGLALFLFGASATCKKDLAVSMDTKFSVNLVQPGKDWPDLRKLSAAQLAAYEKFGKPEFFRIWYNRRGELATGREAGPTYRLQKISTLPTSWIYEEKEVEIQFESPTKFTEIPLSDHLKVMCRRGDPQDREALSPLQGKPRESWTYFDVGEKYFFLDGRLLEKQTFDAVGKPFMRM